MQEQFNSLFLKQLELKNFKSIKGIKLNFSKINLFIGKNNSGKSNILQSIVFLKQMKEGYSINQPFNFISLENIKYKYKNFEATSFTINSKWKRNLAKKDKNYAQLFSTYYNQNEYLHYFEIKDENINQSRIKINFKMNSEKEENITDLLTNKDILIKDLTLNRDNQGFSSISEFLPRIKSHGGSSSDGSSPLSWKYDWNFGNGKENLIDEEKNFERFNKIVDFKNRIIDSLNNLNYIFEPRFITNSIYKLTEDIPKPNDYLLSFDKGGLTSNFLTYNRTSEIKRYPIEKLVQWTEKFGLSNLNGAMIPKYEIKLTVTENGNEQIITNLGSGSKSTLTVLLGCIFSEDNSILLVEEPESGLHPEYQAMMMDFLIDQSKSNKQLFITTHSEQLLMRLQRRIAEEVVKPDDVNIFWVNKIDGETKVEKVEIDVNGIFPEGIKSYLDFTNEESKAIQKARNKKFKRELKTTD